MNQLVEALQSLANQSSGETLDVPHPVDIKNIDVIPLTDWHNSALKEDSYKDDDGDRMYDCVKGRLVQSIQKDEYGEPIGEPKLNLQHKYSHPQRQSKDISVTSVKPQEIRKLRARFPGAFDEYERKLSREGADIPLVLMDDVPPEVVQVIYTLGVRTIRQFAEFSPERMDELNERLLRNKMNARAAYLMDYQGRARARVGYVPRPDDATAATPATRRKSQAA